MWKGETIKKTSTAEELSWKPSRLQRNKFKVIFSLLVLLSPKACEDWINNSFKWQDYRLHYKDQNWINIDTTIHTSVYDRPEVISEWENDFISINGKKIPIKKDSDASITKSN